MMTLSLSIRPELMYIENLKSWWEEGIQDPILKRTLIEFRILIKDKNHDFGKPTEDVPELSMVFSIEHGFIILRPLTFLHLINIVDCFSRPLASSGDAEKLKQNERKHIFKNARKLALVRKKGQTLKYWYDYVAVFSGSYIYFYPVSDQALIFQILRYYKKTDILGEDETDSPKPRAQGVIGNLVSQIGRWGGKAPEKKQPKLKLRDFKNLNYEEFFLLKGCNRVSLL